MAAGSMASFVGGASAGYTAPTGGLYFSQGPMAGCVPVVAGGMSSSSSSEGVHPARVVMPTKVASRVSKPARVPVKSFKNLAVCYPHVAAEWHPTKNGSLIPSKIAPKACRKVWWRCARNPAHEWAARIDNRTRRGQKCPFCGK